MMNLTKLTPEPTDDVGKLIDGIKLWMNKVPVTSEYHFDSCGVGVYLSKLRTAVGRLQDDNTRLRELVGELVNPTALDGDVIYPECEENNAPICVWCGSEYYESNSRCTYKECPVVRGRAELAMNKERCRTCDGTGIVYTMMDETEIGQAPGSSARPCPDCREKNDEC